MSLVNSSLVKTQEKQSKSILVMDSTEKCAGTSLKNYLRTNIPEENFFDLDNGDPPNEPIRGYGIKCPIDFSMYHKKLRDDQKNFYELFDNYINARAEWCIQNISHLEIRCVYGNMLFNTRLIPFMSDLFDVRVCKFFRHPASRIASEYFYVLQHSQHNLHPVARQSSSLMEYALHPERPRNRQVSSVTGSQESTAETAFKIIQDTYFFVGFVENINQDLKTLSEICGLSEPINEKRNATEVKENFNREKNSENYTSLIKVTDSEDSILYNELHKIKLESET